jgi:hypothetical protein
MPSQGDHVRMLIELLQPTGPDLARRWLAALLLVPREDRPDVVASVEDRIASLYTDDASTAEVDESREPREVEVVHPPVQHDGYVEQVRTTYAVEDEKHADPPPHAEPKPLGKSGKGKASQTPKDTRKGRAGKVG